MSSVQTPSRSSHTSRRQLAAKAFFVLAGTLSFLLSVTLFFVLDQREEAVFVGLWVPSLFSLGALVLGPGGWSR